MGWNNNGTMGTTGVLERPQLQERPEEVQASLSDRRAPAAGDDLEGEHQEGGGGGVLIAVLAVVVRG